MGNLISIHALIFVQNDLKNDHCSPLDIITKLLEKYEGGSYNGYPIIIKEGGNHANRHYFISYGEKGEPSELLSFMNSYPKLVSKIFARTYFESGENDYFLFSPFGSSEYEEIRETCKYGFDEIQFKLSEGERIETFEVNLYTEYFQIKIDGDMTAISNLIEQDYRDIIIHPFENYSSIHSYSNNNFNSANNELLNEILAKSVDVRLKYKGKTVLQKLKTDEFISRNFSLSNDKRMQIKLKNAIQFNDGYLDIFSCGWGNCLNKEYLEYTNSIESYWDSGEHTP